MVKKWLIWGAVIILGIAGISAFSDDEGQDDSYSSSNFVPKETNYLDSFDDEVNQGSTYTRTDDPKTTRSYSSTGDRDCGDFDSQQEAQDFFISEGGPSNDYHNLDRDGDGVVCESL